MRVFKSSSVNRGGRAGQPATPIQTRAVRKFLCYDPKSPSGLTWLVNRTNGIKAGDRAGRLSHSGYWQVHVLGKLLLCHRVIWALEHGLRTAMFVDHRDGNRENNKIRNLRCATASQNHQNLKLAKNNTTGTTGVYYIKVTGRYKAQRKVRSFIYDLGMFATKQEAAKALSDFDKSVGTDKWRRRHKHGKA